MNVSELNNLFNTQITDAGGANHQRSVEYLHIHSDDILIGVPLDARGISFSSEGFISEAGTLADNLLVNIVTASAVCESVELELPYNYSFLSDEFLSTASALNVSLVITLPDEVNTESLETFIATTLSISRELTRLDLDLSLIPFDPAIQAYITSKYGYNPKEMSTSSVMNNMFTDRLSHDQIDYIKECFVNEFVNQYGEDFSGQVAQGVYDFFREDIQQRKQTLRSNAKVILTNFEKWHDFSDQYGIDIYQVTAFLFELTMPFWDVFSHMRSHATGNEKINFAVEFSREFFDCYLSAINNSKILSDILGENFQDFDRFVKKTILAFRDDTNCDYDTFQAHKSLFIDEIKHAVLTSVVYKKDVAPSIIATD